MPLLRGCIVLGISVILLLICNITTAAWCCCFLSLANVVYYLLKTLWPVAWGQISKLILQDILPPPSECRMHPFCRSICSPAFHMFPPIYGRQLHQRSTVDVAVMQARAGYATRLRPAAFTSASPTNMADGRGICPRISKMTETAG